MLLPICVVDKLSASKRSALLLHELIHLQRGDHWVRILELTVGVAFWWLPIVRVIGSQLRTCEETSCDAAVVARLPHARRAYAELLLDVVDFTGHLPPKAVAHATACARRAERATCVTLIRCHRRGHRRAGDNHYYCRAIATRRRSSGEM
jgi:beta-lactamase regulating signal transducer with metallopeptidase domain